MFNKYLQGIGKLVLLASIMLASATVAAELYRWVDEDGNVHYGDAIPPKYAPQGHTVLSEHGNELTSVPRAKTEEELATEAQAEALERQRQETLEKQAQAEKELQEQDRRLLDSYGSADAIKKMRDEKIELIEASIALSQSRTGKLEQELLELQEKAANLERIGRPVTDDLWQRLESVNTQIEDNKAFIEARRVEQESLREEYNKNLERYLQLSGEQR